ncbi:ankyrin repeat and protein kinase domain-containing protein 1-like [Ylistrum balloti]|uniref:ankyrin repeat and protein kinase domain-containing protein 1-like n=1 Tax=Ylistrum balloti TaxID=509963 RepID=UPI002905A243|nr:ankyrin repeat and protein kinase domain-containing protein 1-like [Ylistrum balloti]
MTQVAPQQEEVQNLKAQLLFTLRDSKPKEAIKLLKEGAGVDFRDQTGCRPLHYAAKNGYVEVIELLLEKGAQTFAWDNNGQTALHKAVMQGHVQAIVVLVAGGAKIDVIDRMGHLPLEYAVKKKHVAMVELLCQFGAEPQLLDWSWLKDKEITKMKDVMQIAKVLKKQLKNMSGYKHSEIRLDVAMISPGEGSIKLNNTGVEVTANEGQERFYLYLSQTEEAYSTPPPLEEEEQAFGHILEFQTWGAKVKFIALTVTVDRPVPKNEEVVLRPETPRGGIDHVEIQEVDGKEVTKVTLTVPLTSGFHRFAMATREKKQIVKVSKEAVVFKPEVEPEAEIDIPAGTFDSVELSIKFVDTAPVNEDIRDSEEAGQSTEGQMITTNVLDLTTSDDQQPTKDIKMKIPITAKDKSEEFVVMTSSDPDPNLDEWTWEILPAEIDDAGKAVFDIKHLSMSV